MTNLKIRVLIAESRNSLQELYRDNRAERKKKYGSWIINGKLKVSCININHVVSTIGLVRYNLDIVGAVTKRSTTTRVVSACQQEPQTAL